MHKLCIRPYIESPRPLRVDLKCYKGYTMHWSFVVWFRSWQFVWPKSELVHNVDLPAHVIVDTCRSPQSNNPKLTQVGPHVFLFFP